jgi:nitroimidazol reductase NimA-like FMN-containing flavoprotein (pyridoxamine 5'-phosphate oxidase superfamily)
MRQPLITRPRFPNGYLTDPKGLLPWSHVEKKLTEAKNYWLCTVRPNGHPHAVPKWAVWVDGKLYFDGSPDTRHSRNIAENPYVSVHLESGDEAVILDGTARAHPKPSPELGEKLARAYSAKYAALGYAPKADQWDNGGLYEVTPYSALAWTKFTDDPTKFTLEKE